MEANKCSFNGIKKNKQAITLITLNKLTSYADYCSTKVVTLNNAVV